MIKGGDQIPESERCLKPPEFYADAEETGITNMVFQPPWPQGVGWPFRTTIVLAMLRPHDNILELGSGMGILPAMLHHYWRHQGTYLGLDFSKGAIQVADKGNREQGGHPRAMFAQIGLDSDEGRSWVTEYLTDHPETVVVCCETLEHLKFDRELIAAIPSGIHCVLSVPQFWAKSHLRRFETPKTVSDRYGGYLRAQYQQFQFYRAPLSGWIRVWGSRI